MVYVTKADGTKQLFEKWKVMRTCSRLGATDEEARIVADKVEKKIYDGIKTKEILKLIFHYLGEFKPQIKKQIDLRESVCMLRPKPDFEFFVSRLLEEQGYEVERNKKLRGKCVEHEVDAVAKKDNEVIYVEMKHHLNPHVFTGLGVFLKAYASFLDLNDGYRLGKNNIKFNKMLIICSTKLSDHAIQYADCMGISYIAWKVPEMLSLERIIETKKLYPITFIKGLEIFEQSELVNAGIILLRDLLKVKKKKLMKETSLKEKRIDELIRSAVEILG
jgi:hypothetical protein